MKDATGYELAGVMGLLMASRVEIGRIRRGIRGKGLH